MEVKNLCKNCTKYYVFFDDNGEILTDGCKLDLPLFQRDKLVVCSSYANKGLKC